MTDANPLARYPSWATETIRYADTDRQGHVNNAVFASHHRSDANSVLVRRMRALRRSCSLDRGGRVVQ
jgi:hypothetical protein